MTSSPDSLKQTIEQALAYLRTGNPLLAINTVSAHGDVETCAPSCCVLALAAYALSDVGRCAALLRKAHGIEPFCRDYMDLLAGILTRAGRLEEGLFFSKMSVAGEENALGVDFDVFGLSNYFEALKNVSPPTYYRDALVAFLARDFPAVLTHCDRELSFNPDNAPCHTVLGLCMLEMGDFGGARSALQQAVALVPGEPATYLHLAKVHEKCGQFEQAAGCRRQAARLAPHANAVRVATMAGLSVRDDAEWAAHRQALQQDINAALVEQRQSALPSTPFSPAGGDILTVGVLSDSFYNNTLMRLVEPVLASLPDGNTRLVGYQQTPAHDMVTVRLKGLSANWTESYDIDDDTMAAIVAGDEVDVLVDLCGYSEHGRLSLLARRPAASQMAWLGQPCAAGSEGVDGVLSDSILAEADEEVADCPSLLLDNGVIALDPLTEMPEVGPSPFLANGAVTFGTVLDLSAVRPEIAALWADVLNAVPGSRLMLGKVGQASEELLIRAYGLFADYGVSERLLLQVADEDVNVDEDFFAKIDVFLDPYPCSQPFAVAQALWMGVPALAVMTGRRTSRLGASVLNAAGCRNWICPDLDSLSVKAAMLCANPSGLPALRAGLRERVAQSSLFNPDRVADELRVKLRSWVSRRRAGAVG